MQRIADIESAHPDWQRLAAQTTNIFSTWEWAAIWWRHFGGGRALAVSVLRNNAGEPVGLLPLYLWRSRPLRALRIIGHGTGDELGPLYAPGQQANTAAALRAFLADTAADLFVGDRAPSDEPWRELLHGRPLKVEPSPAIRIASVDRQAFYTEHAELRRTVPAKERRLSRNHDVRYRLTAHRDELDRDLDFLFALHRLRWQPESTSFSCTEAFHREFARVAFDRGWLRLWFLEIDGEPRAAWYGFRYRGVESFYQGGRDPSPEWVRYSIGLLVLAHSLRVAWDDGIVEYRFLRGGEAYKSRFTSSTRTVETYAVGRTLRGRAALAAATRLSRSRVLRAAIPR